MMLSLANRPADSNTTYTTGGDVSRFQRRSVPGSAGNGLPTMNPSAMAGRGSASSSAPAVYSGPVVRVSRGNTVSIVPVGAR